MKFLIATWLFSVLLSSAASAQNSSITLWPSGVPDPQPVQGPEYDEAPHQSTDHNPRITNISDPAMLVYPPPAYVKNTGAAILVFPGGAYRFLNMKTAGTDACGWANSVGLTCFIVKYRVPVVGFYPQQKAPLEDAQQAMRIVRSRAAEWGVDPHRIGLMGFSAGANLVLIMNSHPDDPRVLSTPAAKEVPLENGEPVDARSNFTISCWPALIALPPDETQIDPIYSPNQFTPVTFLIQAEDDKLFHNNALVYYRALSDAHIPGELHFYATGGHAFGLHPERYSQAHWTEIATNWLRYNKIIPGWVAPEVR